MVHVPAGGPRVTWLVLGTIRGRNGRDGAGTARDALVLMLLRVVPGTNYDRAGAE